MEEEKGRNNKGIFPAAILFTAEISHVIPAYRLGHLCQTDLCCRYVIKQSLGSRILVQFLILGILNSGHNYLHTFDCSHKINLREVRLMQKFQSKYAKSSHAFALSKIRSLRLLSMCRYVRMQSRSHQVIIIV